MAENKFILPLLGQMLLLAVLTSRAEAACPSLPYNLANGTVADASQVMSNYEALRDCVNDVGQVSPGTAGEIGAYDTSGSVISGKALTDVLDSISSRSKWLGRTSPWHAGVALEVQRHGCQSVVGRGRRWGRMVVLAACSERLHIGFRGLTNLILSDDSDAGLLFNAGSPVSGDIKRAAYENISDPTANWTLTARIAFTMPTMNYSAVGIFCQYSSNSKVVSIDAAQGGNYQQVNWPSLSGYTSVGTTYNTLYPVYWFRLQRIETTIYNFISADGKGWIPWGSEAISGFLGTEPDRAGFFVNYNRTSGPQVRGAVEYWSLTIDN